MDAITTAYQARTRVAPWIGIGAKGEWDDYREALHAGGLDFTVYPRDVYWNKPDGFTLDEMAASSDPNAFTGYPSYMENVDLVANVRGDTNRLLGVVTPRYRIVQNDKAFKIMEQVIRAGGVITNAGMTEQGLCFMVARLSRLDIDGDMYMMNVMVTNSFNGAFPLALIITPVRIICQNMYRGLMGQADNVVRMRHETNVIDRLDTQYDIMGRMNSYCVDFNAKVIKLVDAPMKAGDYQRLLGMLFPYPKPGGAREQTSIARIESMREEFTRDYYNVADNMHYVGTAFGFLNAYMDWLSHAGNGKRTAGSWQDKRLSKLVSGDLIKHNVISECMKLA